MGNLDFVPFSQVRPVKASDQSVLTEHPRSANRNNNAVVSFTDTIAISSNSIVKKSIKIEKQAILEAKQETNHSIQAPVEFNKPILVDDSTDEVCPMLSPDDDTSMAEFGYSGIQGEECADTGAAMEEPAITDELFGEGGEEAFQLDPEAPEFQPIGAGGEESHDRIGPIRKQLYLWSAGEAGGENPTPSLYYEVTVTSSVNRLDICFFHYHAARCVILTYRQQNH